MKIRAMTKRKIDSRNRIILPKEMVDILEINPSDNLTVRVIENNKKLSIKIEKE